MIAGPGNGTTLEREHLTHQELAAPHQDVRRLARANVELEIFACRGLEHQTWHMQPLVANCRRAVEFAARRACA